MLVRAIICHCQGMVLGLSPRQTCVAARPRSPMHVHHAANMCATIAHHSFVRSLEL